MTTKTLDQYTPEERQKMTGMNRSLPHAQKEENR